MPVWDICHTECQLFILTLRMITLIMLILAFAIILSFGLMVKCPKYGLWLYKGAIFGIMIIFLFVVLFFWLGGNGDETALNINLHPWRNYLRYRVAAAVACVTLFLAASQLPLLFVKCYAKKKKWQIIK